MVSFELFLFFGSFLILVSVFITRFSHNFGIPALLLFLVVGILAGPEGPLGFHFTDIHLAQSIALVSLIFILFDGGLETHWSSVRPIAVRGGTLATIGVGITATVIGIAAMYVLRISLLEAMLLGAIVSSTDAAAVFSILRSRQINLRGTIAPLLEFESGSNDPMAVFLTLSFIEMLTVPETSPYSLITRFLMQMGIGGIVGFSLGRLMVHLLNRLKVSHEGLYPVFALAFSIFIYGVTTIVQGSGFLAVYIAGIVVGNNDFIQKKTMIRFFNGTAWLSQISMFLALGLLIVPSELLGVTGEGFLIAAVLMFVARPVSVFISLTRANFSFKEKIFISWVGIRGAVPVILATFPLVAGISVAHNFFYLTFFVVITSVVFQGWTVPILAKRLGLVSRISSQYRLPLEFASSDNKETELVDFIVPYHSAIIGRPIVEIGMPKDSLIVLVSRDNKFVVPSGGTVLEEGDTLLVLVTKQNVGEVRRILSQRAPF